MSEITSDTIKEDFLNLIKSPTRSRDFILDRLIEMSDGKTINLDPGNPVVYMFDMSSIRFKVR